MSPTRKIKVEDVEISIFEKPNEADYISLTDMARYKEDTNNFRSDALITNWLKTKDTLEFLGLWESINNPDFNPIEFDGIKREAGTNRFIITIKQWCEKTNAVGIISRPGRYGGTFAHKDIAFEFGAWLSPMFRLYLIKEYQYLKETESNQYNLEWNVRRILSKANYRVHTDAIDKHIIPTLSIQQKKEWIYASEADLLNIAMFRCTAKQWREVNAERVLRGENIRDMASINELLILANLENLNADMIKRNIPKTDRLRALCKVADEQKELLDKVDVIKSLKKVDENTLMEAQKQIDEQTDTKP